MQAVGMMEETQGKWRAWSQGGAHGMGGGHDGGSWVGGCRHGHIYVWQVSMGMEAYGCMGLG